MSNNYEIHSKKTVFKRIYSWVFGALIALVTLFPFYWLLISSLKPDKEIFATPPTLFPSMVTFKNFADVILRTSIPRYFLNSIINAGLTVLIVIIVASLAAYSISRYRFKGKTAIFIMMLLAQILPLTTLIIPLYIMIGKLKLTNSYLSLVATYSATLVPVAVWLLVGYFNSIPKEIDEAATVDGCPSLRILFQIIMPLAKPGIMAAGLSVIITVWQELMIAMTFTTVDSMRPLMAGVSSFITRTGIEWGPMNASGILTCIPVIIIFLFFQKALVRGLTNGSVKG